MEMGKREKSNGGNRTGNVEPNAVDASPEVDTSQCVSITLRESGIQEFEHVTSFDVDANFVTVAWREDGKVEARGFNCDEVLSYEITVDEAEVDAQRAMATEAHKAEIRMQAEAVASAQRRRVLGGVQ
jgi:hypothetical protein